MGSGLAVRLDVLADSERARELERLDAYHESRQYDQLRYDWDGYLDGYSDADVQPGWYIPAKRRKPATRLELTRLVVSRLTAFMLGDSGFPAVHVEGDDAAEDFVRALVDESALDLRLQEARGNGGACGTAVMSYGFVDGKPRVSVHHARHMHPLRWVDRTELVLGAVLKVKKYRKTLMVEGARKEVDRYFVRYWDESREIVWEDISAEQAKLPDWSTAAESYSVEHGYGRCPVIWCQNLPNSDGIDGYGDMAGLQGNSDHADRLLSSTHKGTAANVDPTLVVHDDPRPGFGSIKKGSENAIFCKGGASYLELKGEALRAALDLVRYEVETVKSVTGIVVTDADSLLGAAKTAAGLRLLFRPMISACNLRRRQYGRGLIVPLLQGMLEAARAIGARPPGPIITTSDGRRIQEQPVVTLEPRLEEGREIPRTPGTSSRLRLDWPEYFELTAEDTGKAVDAAVKARGTLVSDETATRYVAEHFGVQDVEQELERLEHEADERAARLPSPDLWMPPQPPPQVAPQTQDKDDDDDLE